MTRTFATFEHSRIGFPGVALKWTEENGKITTAYTTIRGIIHRDWTWFNPHPEPFIESELARFDDYVTRNFSEDASVQG